MIGSKSSCFFFFLLLSNLFFFFITIDATIMYHVMLSVVNYCIAKYIRLNGRKKSLKTKTASDTITGPAHRFSTVIFIIGFSRSINGDVRPSIISWCITNVECISNSSTCSSSIMLFGPLPMILSSKIIEWSMFKMQSFLNESMLKWLTFRYLISSYDDMELSI